MSKRPNMMGASEAARHDLAIQRQVRHVPAMNHGMLPVGKDSSVSGLSGGCYAKCLENVVTKEAGNSDTVTIDADDFRGRWVHGMVVVATNRNATESNDWHQISCLDETEVELASDNYTNVLNGDNVDVKLVVDGTDAGKLKMTFSDTFTCDQSILYFVRATTKRCPTDGCCYPTCQVDPTNNATVSGFSGGDVGFNGEYVAGSYSSPGVAGADHDWIWNKGVDSSIIIECDDDTNTLYVSMIFCGTSPASGAFSTPVEATGISCENGVWSGSVTDSGVTISF